MLYEFNQLLRQHSLLLVYPVLSLSYFMNMAKLVTSAFIGSGSLWMYLDNELIMQNSDTLTIELKEDAEYVVHWFVQSAAGGSYSITISSPREAQYQLTRAVGKGGKDFGAFKFLC